MWQAADDERNDADCEGILKPRSSSCSKKRQRVEEGDQQRGQFSCMKKAELVIELKKRGQAANIGLHKDILLERLRQCVQTQPGGDTSSHHAQQPAGGGRTAGASSHGGLAATAAANPADKASTERERTFTVGGPHSKKQRNASTPPTRTTGAQAVGGIRQMGGRTPPTSNCGGCYSAAAGTHIVEPCGHHCCERCIERWGCCLPRGDVCPVATCRQTYTTVRLTPIR